MRGNSLFLWLGLFLLARVVSFYFSYPRGQSFDRWDHNIPASSSRLACMCVEVSDGSVIVFTTKTRKVQQTPRRLVSSSCTYFNLRGKTKVCVSLFGTADTGTSSLTWSVRLNSITMSSSCDVKGKGEYWRRASGPGVKSSVGRRFGIEAERQDGIRWPGVVLVTDHVP